MRGDLNLVPLLQFSKFWRMSNPKLIHTDADQLMHTLAHSNVLGLVYRYQLTNFHDSGVLDHLRFDMYCAKCISME